MLRWGGLQKPCSRNMACWSIVRAGVRPPRRKRRKLEQGNTECKKRNCWYWYRQTYSK
jgi:hypothetical protein